MNCLLVRYVYLEFLCTAAGGRLHSNEINEKCYVAFYKSTLLSFWLHSYLLGKAVAI